MFALSRAFLCAFVAAQFLVPSAAEAQTYPLPYARMLTVEEAREVLQCLCATALFWRRVLPPTSFEPRNVISKDEAKFVFENGCEQLVVGSGQMGNVRLSPEAEAYFAKKDCKVLLQPTPEAINAFNGSHANKIGLFHVTC